MRVLAGGGVMRLCEFVAGLMWWWWFRGGGGVTDCKDLHDGVYSTPCTARCSEDERYP